MIFISMTSEVVWQCDTPSQVGRLYKYSTLSHTLLNTYIFKVIVVNLLCSIKICHLSPKNQFYLHSAIHYIIILKVVIFVICTFVLLFRCNVTAVGKKYFFFIS